MLSRVIRKSLTTFKYYQKPYHTALAVLTEDKVNIPPNQHTQANSQQTNNNAQPILERHLQVITTDDVFMMRIEELHAENRSLKEMLKYKDATIERLTIQIVKLYEDIALLKNTNIELLERIRRLENENVELRQKYNHLEKRLTTHKEELEMRLTTHKEELERRLTTYKEESQQKYKHLEVRLLITTHKEELEKRLITYKEEFEKRLKRLELNEDKIIIGQIGFVLEKAISQYVLGDPSLNISYYYNSNPRAQPQLSLNQNDIYKLTGQKFQTVFQKIIEIKRVVPAHGNKDELAKLTTNDLVEKIDKVAEASDKTQCKHLLDVIVMLKQNTMFPLR